MDRTDGATPLRRETLAQQVRDALLDEVRTSRPGATLPSESRLVQRFGVGRQVVREALQSLQAMGVVQVVNGRGAVVRPLSSEPLRSFFERARGLTEGLVTGKVEILEVRRAIEMQSAYLAAERRDDAQLELITSIVAEMDQAVADLDPYAELDSRFHHAVSAASGNTMLALLEESVREPMHETIALARTAHDFDSRHRRIHELHRRVADYIQAQDATAARDAMARHFDEAIAAVRAADRELRPEANVAADSTLAPHQS